MKMNNSEFNLKNTAQWEKILFAVILLLAFLTRFSELGVRAMSHDESLHTYYSYLFADGSGYAHNPMMHGPLQFHLLNASYQLLGVTDFTARIPAALCGVLSIALVWLLRKDLGKVGTFVAMGLFLISPYLLFYSRYVRNEALLMPIAILTLWSILRYFQTEDKQYLLWLTVVSALNFTIKETAFLLYRPSHGVCRICVFNPCRSTQMGVGSASQKILFAVDGNCCSDHARLFNGGVHQR